MAPAISLAQTRDSVFDEVMTVNLKAPFFLIQALADHIRDNGRIINISTGFTRVAAPTHPAYAASKGALETLTLHYGRTDEPEPEMYDQGPWTLTVYEQSPAIPTHHE